MSQRVILATIVAVAVLIGLNFSILKFALDHATPFAVTAMRTVIGGSFLVGFALYRGEKLPRDRTDLRNVFVVGFSITTVSSALLVFGVSRVPAGVASLIASTMPLFTALLSVALLRAALPNMAKVGLAIGFAGTVLLAAPSMTGEAAAVGIGALLLSALAWAFGTVYMKWQDLSNVSPIMLVGVQLVMSAAMLVPFALIVEGTGGIDWSLGLLWPLLYASIPANAVTFSLIATVVAKASPTQASSTAYLIPLFGVLFGWLIRSERLGLAELGGGVLIIVGVYLLVSATARRATRA